MHVTPHIFRHTHETILWESGVADINYIGARLGDTNKRWVFQCTRAKVGHSQPKCLKNPYLSIL